MSEEVMLPEIESGAIYILFLRIMWFWKYLLSMGGGTKETNSDHDVRLLDKIWVTCTGKDIT
jgi:hypothetical protein